MIYGVFTDTALAGNPLAIVFDADDLDDRAMQAIAREFNFSETVFLTQPANPVATAGVRIFTPDYELPFAGHPTVGTAIAIAQQRGSKEQAALLVLEEKVGLVRCAVSFRGEQWFGEFDLPRLPEQLSLQVETETIAAALGIEPHEIGFENHQPSYWTAGNEFVFIPVSGLDVAARIRLDPHIWDNLGLVRASGSVASPYVYCRETVRHDCNFHSRMMVSGNGVYEDPATGSAAAAFAGAINQFDKPVDGPCQIWIEQGVEMNRPSSIRLEMDIEAGAISAARIGGHAVKVAEGTLAV
ncbi:PhzF family phenazine biosynthesis protein [Tianweitania sp. BSSL-BM11]|uniref:PhzF family phenazine biosynthesis protein n=2 Tax=Tianweitania aestuarii TaxID=2814886 RepID=A0ABS5RUX8_9HYPH|nr:PhzF family phenazine biosynthesis protein [Tianweitania aestuarii]